MEEEDSGDGKKREKFGQVSEMLEFEPVSVILIGRHSRLERVINVVSAFLTGAMMASILFLSIGRNQITAEAGPSISWPFGK